MNKGSGQLSDFIIIIIMAIKLWEQVKWNKVCALIGSLRSKTGHLACRGLAIMFLQEKKDVLGTQPPFRYTVNCSFVDKY